MLAVISHDAGGAEVLSSFVRRSKPNCLFVLEGPARNIFKRKLESIPLTSLNVAIEQTESILCGSSWKSDLEIEAIKLSKSLGKRSVVFLDHWVNYMERFTRSGISYLPDEIWVGDQPALSLAEKTFSSIPICFVENPYFQDIREQLMRMSAARLIHSEQSSILYVCEPIRDHAIQQHGKADYWGYTEEEALRYFLSHLTVLTKNIGRIVIRPHPSEDHDKYNWVLSEFNLPITIGGKEELIDEIVKSDIVAGCESMAMVIGLIAGKRVVSSIPPGGRTCILPQIEIEHLQKIL